MTTVLANAFVDRGHSVSIVSFEQLVPELLEQLDDRVRFHPMSHPFARKENQLKLHGLLVEEGTDFILNQWCLPFYVTRFCRAAMRGTNCKLLGVHHNAPDQNSLLNDVRIQLDFAPSFIRTVGLKLKLCTLTAATIFSMRYVYRNSDRYVVLSESFVSLFQRFTKIGSTGKLAVIGNPLTLDTEGFQYDADSKEKLIIYVGRIDHNQKRVERVIETWERIAPDLPDWRLEIVGDGPERERLEELALDKGLSRVSFEGFQDPIDYYKRASILLLTSEYEGFGLVIVEAMAFGCVPVVLGSYSAVFDIISNSKDGYIIDPPYDLGRYAQCVQTLAHDNENRIELAETALGSAEKFSLNHVVPKWEHLLQKF